MADQSISAWLHGARLLQWHQHAHLCTKQLVKQLNGGSMENTGCLHGGWAQRFAARWRACSNRSTCALLSVTTQLPADKVRCWATAPYLATKYKGIVRCQYQHAMSD